MVVLVLGFGPFGGVTDNPARRLALALDGRPLGSGRGRVVGREMPVAYDRCARVTMEAAKELAPAFVLGVGVAPTRSRAEVEAVARNVGDPTWADVDGITITAHGEGPPVLRAADAAPLAEALGVGLSDDAGAYVCNGWLYRALRAGLPAGFLHVPLDGLAPEPVLAGLGRFMGGDRAVV
jgi:pyroglutamyl-peptidase